MIKLFAVHHFFEKKENNRDLERSLKIYLDKKN